MQKLIVDIPFRDDYNGRPHAYLTKQDIVIKTHPYYCWEKKNYGRMYRYDVFDKDTHQKKDILIYAYDVAAFNLRHTINTIINDLGNSEKEEHTYQHKNGLFSIKKVESKNAMAERPKLVGKMREAKLDDDVYGFVIAHNCVYHVIGKFKDFEYEEFRGFEEIEDLNMKELVVDNYDDFFVGGVYYGKNVVGFVRSDPSGFIEVNYQIP
jgi:hypothetical protein